MRRDDDNAHLNIHAVYIEIDRYVDQEEWSELRKYLSDNKSKFRGSQIYSVDYFCKSIELSPPKVNGKSNYTLFIKRLRDLLHLNFSEERVDRMIKACNNALQMNGE